MNSSTNSTCLFPVATNRNVIRQSDKFSYAYSASASYRPKLLHKILCDTHSTSHLNRVYVKNMFKILRPGFKVWLIHLKTEWYDRDRKNKTTVNMFFTQCTSKVRIFISFDWRFVWELNIWQLLFLASIRAKRSWKIEEKSQKKMKWQCIQFVFEIFEMFLVADVCICSSSISSEQPKNWYLVLLLFVNVVCC